MSTILARLNLLTRLEVKDTAFLASSGEGWRLSLYLPFDKNWRESAEEKIQLRDLRREAKRNLEARGASAPIQEALLAPIDSLLSAPDAARLSGEGLALFVSVDRALALLLPKAPAPWAGIDTRFRIDGILPQIYGRDRFHLLALSQHAVRLWDCDGVAMRAIPLDGIETDIRLTRHFEQAERQASVHTNSSGHHGHARGDSGHFVSGPGDGKEAKKEIEVFFRQIDHGIRARLPDDGKPLLLAGVAYLLPIYRRVNTCASLIEDELPGHPGSLGSPEDLHVRANAVMAERQRLDRNLAMGLFVENLARPRSGAGYSDVVPSAFQRRLTHLFLSRGRGQWGDFDPATGAVRTYDAFQTGTVDLGNLACAYAIQGHAKVYDFDANEMPAGAGIAALFRA
jgi:hypothetical protein